MPGRSEIEEAVRRCSAAFAARDRDAWLATFAEDATQEDPVGATNPPRAVITLAQGSRTSLVLVVFALLMTMANARAQEPARRASATPPSDPAAAVLAFERDIEAAVVRGDVAYLDRASTSDFSFTHGDGWTTGGEPLRVENKAQWLAAVRKAPYLFRNLDSVRVEMHGDIAITYGRYRARFKEGAPGHREFTVWFERVYVRRDGRWLYVSHRTVNGPAYVD
jgi:ketosteroid isomerase-like protein